MKKGKFKGAILACSLLAFGAIITTTTFGLTSCGQTEEKPTVDPYLKGVTAFEITNKTDFDSNAAGYAWYPGDADKEIKLSFTGAEVNLLKAFQNKHIEITSSNPKVASVINNYVAPVAPGEAKITVLVHTDKSELKQELNVKVLTPVPQPEAKKVTIKELNAMSYDAWLASRPQQDYIVTGTVVDWYRDSAPTKYGNFNIKDDEGNTILVYGATLSESALTYGPNGTWKFSNPKDFLDKDGKAPCKIGDKVTLHTTLTAYKSVVQLNGVITKVEEGTEEPGGGETVEDPIKNAKAISIADLAKKTEPETTQLYKVTGVVTSANAGDKYGNIVITDKTTGASVASWGTAKDETCWTFNKDGVAITFTNPKDFDKECLGKKFNLGDEVEFLVYVAPKSYGGKGVDLNFSFVKKVTEASALKYKVTFEGESAKYFEALTKTDYAFGEEVILTPKASEIPAGKELKVTVGEEVITKNDEGKYVFAANVVNKITVSLVEAGAIADVIVTADELGLTGSYGDYDAAKGFIDINGLKFGYYNIMKGSVGGGTIQMNSKNKKGGSVWVGTPSDKEIEKVVIKGAKNGWDTPATNAMVFTTFSTTAGKNDIDTFDDESKIPAELNAIKSKFDATTKDFTVVSNVEGAKAFSISHLNKSGVTYIESIEVFYK